MKNYKLTWIIALSFSMAFISCKKHETTLSEDNRSPVSVKLATVNGGSTDSYFTVSGKVQSENQVTVSSRMMGYITSTNVKVGDQVRAGQSLATISDADIQPKIAQANAAVVEAQANLSNIEKDYARIKSLFEKQSATQKELDDISTQMDMMKARLTQANEVKNAATTMLSYTRITAPISGVVTEKFISNGDLANPGQPIFSLESGNNFEVAAMIPESYIGSIEKGDKVKVFLKSNDQEIDGTVDELSRSALNTGGQYLIKINLDAKTVKALNIFSGMYANVQINRKNKATETEKILVNKDAIVQQGQLSGIYTVSEDNKAFLRWVRLGDSYGDQVEVLSGLSQGEQYITESESRILNGIKVNVSQ
ncbi:MAG: efflux RND transporter periplasmic adaptor subunit [Chitinophagales bacterium]